MWLRKENKINLKYNVFFLLQSYYIFPFKILEKIRNNFNTNVSLLQKN